MYQERSSIFSVRKVILAILVMVLVFFILMWLFPTKGYLTNNEKSANVAKTFSDNITLMKNSALSYYTDERLPENTGDKEKMTLSDMIDKHLITELVDSNNKICNLKKSYVEITKEETEYLMKINLSCEDKSDYINTHMGSYTYCTDAICEKKNKLVSDTSPNTENTSIKDTTNETKNVQTNVQTTSKKTTKQLCKYIKTIKTYTNYGNFSNWSKVRVTPSDTRNVQTKTVYEQTGEEVKNYTTEERYPAARKENGVYYCINEQGAEERSTSEFACKRKVTVTKKVPVYGNVTYYRYQDRRIINKTDTKWYDCNITPSGYKRAGN